MIKKQVINAEDKADWKSLIQQAAANGIPICEATLRAFEKLHDKGQGQPWRTLLAVCPNSEAVLNAALLAAKKADAPIMFAATLNQVDLDGGYTGWTQAQFAALARKQAARIGFDGPVIIGMDHAGPWLKDKQTIGKWPFAETMQAVKDSLTAAIDAGYDLLHIDPTVDRELKPGGMISIETVVERTVELIAHCEAWRVRRELPPIAYEVGTEEVHGGVADLATFRKFLDLLNAGLRRNKLYGARPSFVVGKVGTDLHTTEFSSEMAETLHGEAAPYGALIKGHYTDNVSNPEAYPQSRMGGANVGPEFTEIECDALARLEGKERAQTQAGKVGRASGFGKALEDAVVRSNRWRKWLQPGETGKEFAELSDERRLWLARTGARYIWTDPAVLAARTTLYDNLRGEGFDPDGYVVDEIAAGMIRYFHAFNLVGSLTDLEKEFHRRALLPFWGEGDIVSAGELIVEIMRPGPDQPLDTPGHFEGPFPSGAPAIFASAAARIGKKVGFVGSVGEDGFGHLLINRLVSDGVDTRMIRRVSGEATGCAFVAYAGDGSRKFIYHIAETASGRLDFSMDDVAVYASAFRHCHLMGCSLSINEPIRRVCMGLAQAVKASGGTVSLDPNLRPEILGLERCRAILMPVLALADIVLPSGDEASLLTGESNADAACASLLRMGVQVVALKRGGAGCRVFYANEHADIPGFRVDVADPTGAGDCFDAGFVSGWLENMPPREAALFANAMGALGASRRGPMEGIFARGDVTDFITNNQETD
ncbi:MAG: PfkB family carbohydrate kinase [bacterium]|nr:PfkB family carbohydrate kinase [Candidatus Sumerlaeota bacterium]